MAETEIGKMMPPHLPATLTPAEVYRATDPAVFGFDTTAPLPEFEPIIGQERAVESVEFGMEIDTEGYNVVAVGPPGTGKQSTIFDYLKRQAASLPVPNDWVYVYNFQTPYQPKALSLPAGKGKEFAKDMDKLVEDLRAAITRAFDSEEYEKQRQRIAQEVGEKQEGKLEELRQKADAAGFMMVRTPAGLAFAPKGKEGEPMAREVYEALSAEEQKKIDDAIEALNGELQQIMRLVRLDERGGRDALHELDRQVTESAAKHLIEDACEKWCEITPGHDYLKEVLKDVVENGEDFKKSDEETPAVFMGMPIAGRQRGDGVFRKYKVNVFVDNSDLTGAPVINETNPTFQNLIGRIEHQAQFGALVTDFHMIKAGSLHKVNGGFLVVDTRDLLTKPFSWDGLKRTLKTHEIRVEDAGQQLGFMSTASLDPEPIPFKGKIILIGEPMIYYLLFAQDPDFPELFKVKADFAHETDRTAENERLFARFIAHVAASRSLVPFAPDAVARLIEQGSRWVEDQRKVTTRLRDLIDLATEASYWARKKNGGSGDGKPGATVTRDDVEKAIEHKIYRSNLLEERVREMIADHTIMVDTSGAVAGQVNGLSVSMVGDYAFGRPSRITATTRLGDGEVVDIEREVEMGGPIHSKGVLILAGYLGAKYASDEPLSLNARLVFEQSYSGVEGDSASSAELYALLSSLSGVPVQQRFAVTGSVNQRGQVQAIGGVNEKIEGFFEVCRAMGLKGDEGVLIPKANVPHLMLNQTVRKAIEDGTFRIYPVSTIDEGISILTGVAAGEAAAEDKYPDGTVNAQVMRRLKELTQKAIESKRKRDEPEKSKEEKVPPEQRL